MNFVVAGAMSNVLKTLVVMSSPEEWDVAIWDKLAHHVESSVRPLIKSVDPVLNSSLLTSLPIWERANISSRIDVWSC